MDFPDTLKPVKGKLGFGLLLVGDSGMGKSETAVELLKRGHRLVADDAVEIRRVATNSLMGTAPRLIRNYVEMTKEDAHGKQ